uniref:Uncharacterized protein n=1 Tax=Onchocerca volvulus TaxID=6282 RepID=A0A8R1TNT0_ONCVO
MVLQCFENANAVMFRVVVLLTVFAFLVNFVIALIGEVQQLREVLGMFDKDYKQGNMTRLESDFKNALEKYGDGFVFLFSLFCISTFTNNCKICRINRWLRPEFINVKFFQKSKKFFSIHFLKVYLSKNFFYIKN